MLLVEEGEHRKDLPGPLHHPARWLGVFEGGDPGQVAPRNVLHHRHQVLLDLEHLVQQDEIRVL